MMVPEGLPLHDKQVFVDGDKSLEAIPADDSGYHTIAVAKVPIPKVLRICPVE